MNRTDWDKGLPYDVMAIIFGFAKGEGVSMTTTRSVCKGWKAGSEGVINKLKIPYNSPVPASFFTLGDRFPELTHLDLGESRTTVDKLNQLQGIKKLTNLKLGARKSPGLYFQTGFPKVIESKPPEFPKECMALSLQYDKLDDVRRIRTIQVLDLRGCTDLDDKGMGHLRGMRLQQLVLVRSKKLTDRALGCLRGMPLTKLTLEQITKLTPAGVRAHLLGLPLVWLSLSGCLGMTDEIIPILSNLPNLEHLSLNGCHKLSAAAFAMFAVEPEEGQPAKRVLPELKSLDLGLLNNLMNVSIAHLAAPSAPPLTRLYLDGCKKMDKGALEELGKLTDLVDLSLARWVKTNDEGMAHLQIPDKLTKLNMENHHQITDVTLQYLANKPLTSLDMRRCQKVTHAGFYHLRDAKLEFLYLRRCKDFCDLALGHLGGMSLRELDLRRCDKLTNNGIQVLVDMPLRYLDLGHCSLITDEGLVHLRKMPLEYLSLVSLTNAVTAAGLANVRDAPLVYLDIRHCPAMPPLCQGVAEFKKYFENRGRKIQVLTA